MKQVYISDIQRTLSCTYCAAHEIMVNELKSTNASHAISPTEWRATQRDFENWLKRLEVVQ